MAAVAIIAVSALYLFWPVTFGAGEAAVYPWASDTMGHLLKVEFIAEEIRAGNFYPQLFPDWYSGVQLLRYFPPLSYYLVTGIFFLTGNIFLSAGVFVFGAALFGGMSFLLYRRWLGLIPATVAGVVFIALPDNLRVAMAEGNLPRVLATALLPLTFYLLLSILTQGHSRVRFASLAILMMLIILSHAMMGAIFFSCLALTVFIYWIMARAQPRDAGSALAALACGVLLSGWWLLPSLTGGITELNSEVASEALASFPLTQSLDPTLRAGNKEVYYLGLSLVAATLLAMFNWRKLTPLNRSVVTSSLIVLAVSTTVFNPVYRTIPLSEIMWPLRFMSFAGFVVLLGVSLWAARLLEGSIKAKAVAVVLLAALLIDAYPSKDLVFLRPPTEDLPAVVAKVEELPGWRVATTDFSRLGSRASYRFSADSNREQVYGWAYQGSGIASLLASVNFAIEKGHAVYAVDRLEEMGTDYVVRLKDAPIDEAFDLRLIERGYEIVEDTPSLLLYHRDGGPRAYVAEYEILGIGGGSSSLSLLFPEILVASSQYIDDYALEDLQRFPTLVLAGFSWRNLENAESLVTEYANQGGRVIVDLTGVPMEVFSRRPKFLGVYGEPVSLYAAPVIEYGPESGFETRRLRGFDAAYAPWSAISPQGLDESTVTFGYLGQVGTAVGYKELGAGRAWFLGLNLAFHSMLSKDPVGIELLEDVIGIESGMAPARQTVAMDNYNAGSDGYTFSYTLEEAELLLIPVARHDGTVVTIDGARVNPVDLGDLTYINAPAGIHTVHLGFEKTPVYRVGIAVTLFAFLVMGYGLLGSRIRSGFHKRKMVHALILRRSSDGRSI